MARDGMIQVRVDSKLKRDADELFTELGLDTASAVRLFLKQAVLFQGIPFPVRRVEHHETAQTDVYKMEAPVQTEETESIINDLY